MHSKQTTLEIAHFATVWPASSQAPIDQESKHFRLWQAALSTMEDVIKCVSQVRREESISACATPTIPYKPTDNNAYWTVSFKLFFCSYALSLISFFWLTFLSFFLAFSPASPGEVPFAILAANGFILRINLDFSNTRTIYFSSVYHALSCDFDITTRHVYFIAWQFSRQDLPSYSIRRITLTGAEDTELVGNGDIGEANSIEVDWVHRKLYWTDSQWGLVLIIGIHLQSGFCFVETFYL